MNKQNLLTPFKNPRIRLGSLICLLGLLVFLVGAHPEWFGVDRSPVIGFVQITVFLVGLGMICIGGYLVLAALWNGTPKSIVSDFGLRLISTGFVIALACGMADIFGFGSQTSPLIPYFGFYQMIGVLIGEIVIGAGMIMMIPFHKTTG
ncbi:MAG: hypothetical protein MUC85_08095 [Anaerolineales bacterium]|jgi:hypothetical protein|nr:hypothetical protein [Anaerolineales bacterium]